LQQKAGAPYGFAMAWQNAAYRWLPFLYQHGGQLLDAELRHPQIATATGIETIAWTQSWFRDGLVPPSTSIKSNEQTRTCSPMAPSACCLAATGKSVPQSDHDQVQMGRYVIPAPPVP
jgi:ABC-type glycerol-3-phosphate transport system substrate-binding protein